MTDREIKVAVLDMNNNTPNEGMRCVREMLEAQQRVMQISLTYQVFDVRDKCELPDLSFDIYISTGGPGSPFEGEGSEWENAFFQLIDNLWQHNQENRLEKKYVFFICHSFQLMCRYFGLGKITQRAEMAFGVTQVEKTLAGKKEALFTLLENEFYVADFRSFQVIEPNKVTLQKLGATILTQESLEDAEAKGIRAVTAIRLSSEMIGTQFHPEADPGGMYIHFQKPEKKALIIKKYGEENYLSMLADFKNPLKITKTHNAILPSFLRDAVNGLMETHLFSL
jgi:GMP synthase-like glutamine amidotransferase